MATSKVAPKKSLFKKPAWASTSTNTVDDSDTPIFGQAHHYQEIIEDEKRRRERYSAKQKELAEKKLKEDQERESKRRRISNEAEDSDYGSDSDTEKRSPGSPSLDSPRSQRSATPIKEKTTRVLRSTPQKVKRGSATSPLSKRHAQEAQLRHADDHDVLNVDGDEDIAQSAREDSDLYEVPQSKTLQPMHKQPEPEPDSEEEDDYLRELKAKAREEARTKITNSITVDENLSNLQATQAFDPATADVASPSNSADVRSPRANSTPADSEDEVKIWIKTIIPGAKDVIVSRKIGQPLDKVKEFWIKRNELEPAIAQKVFFTWNGTRLYNSTTMRGIIERLKKLYPVKDGSDPSRGKIMIEAVTDEIFEYRQKQRADKLAEAERVTNSEVDQYQGTNDDGTDDNGSAVPQAQTNGIVIKLKAQGFEELNLRVRPNTTIRKILNGFCKLKGVQSGQYKEQWLSYDGERLNEDATVEDVGFENEDTVEVYLR